jgi:hypothetical protein
VALVEELAVGTGLIWSSVTVPPKRAPGDGRRIVGTGDDIDGDVLERRGAEPDR